MKKKGTPIAAIVICIVAILLVAAAATALLYINQQRAQELEQQAIQEQERLEQERTELLIAQNKEYDAIVNSSVFLEGVTVNGLSIAGKTMEEARSFLEENFGSTNLDGSLKLVLRDTDVGVISLTEEDDVEITAENDDVEELTGAAYEAAQAAMEAAEDEQEEVPAEENTVYFDMSCVTASSNINDVLTQAFRLARNGSQESVLSEAKDIRENGRDFTLEVVYDYSAVSGQVERIANAIDRPAENASIGSIDKELHTIQLVEGRDGIRVQRDELEKAIITVIASGDTASDIEIPYEPIPFDKDTAVEYMSVSFTTSFKGSSSNRIFNINKGANLINGTILRPGETFSTNGKLGTRTLKNGWKTAHAYVNGSTEEQAGGGVCQLSSTLYNAIVRANLEVVSRRNHSMKVTYVPQGLDATINSVGNMIDFKFRNNTEYDIVIFAYTSGKNLTMTVYRCKLTEKEFEAAGTEFDTINLTSKKVKTLTPSGDWNITLDNKKPAGYEEITQERKNGSQWQSYKHYLLNGKEVKVEKLDSSIYKAYPGAKIVGPAAPDPTPTPKPAATEKPTPTEKPEPTPPPATESPSSND